MTERADINLILVFENDFIDEHTVRLSARRHKHILEIQRAVKDRQLVIGKVNGPLGTGRVIEVNDKYLVMDVSFSAEPPVGLAVNLILALPRPIVLKRILADASSLGVKKIFLVNSRRVEKSFWKSHTLSEENITQQLLLGLEQGRDTVLPQVFMRRRFKPFVEDELPQLIQGHSAWVPHPEADRLCPSQIPAPASVFIGPEGGFIPYEIEALQAIGFQCVGLGARILRVETAVPFMLSRLAQ